MPGASSGAETNNNPGNSTFPDSDCRTQLPLSPYRATLQSSEPAPGGGGSVLCFGIVVVPCIVDNDCCQRGLYKLQMPVRKCGMEGLAKCGRRARRFNKGGLFKLQVPLHPRV
eukprot:359547-Chlamydomonas_euryale.AAC.3